MKTKKKYEYVEVIEVPVGSLVLPPHKIKKTFRKIFNSGLKCHEHQHDEYIAIVFNDAFEKTMKPFRDNIGDKNKYSKGGTKCK